jgi:hypothetical protein
MSKTSYALIGVIVAALIFMGAVRWHERRQLLQEQTQQAAMHDGEPFSFQHIPVDLAAPQPELMQDPIPYKRPLPEIYVEDTPLPPAQQIQQAQDTVHSIIDDFNNEPALAKFNQELQAASHGQINSLEDLSTQNLEQILQQNPEVNQIVQKHLKQPDFQQIITQIFQNPQFQQSVQTLQGPGAQISATR